MLSTGSSILGQSDSALSSYPKPVLFLTVKENKESEEVIQILRRKIQEQKTPACYIFESKEELSTAFSNGFSPDATVALFDGELQKRDCRMLTKLNPKDTRKLPEWGKNIVWGIKVSKKCKDKERCAQQIFGIFIKKFFANPEKNIFPWGTGKRSKAPSKEKMDWRMKRKERERLEFFSALEV